MLIPLWGSYSSGDNGKRPYHVTPSQERPLYNLYRVQKATSWNHWTGRKRQTLVEKGNEESYEPVEEWGFSLRLSAVCVQEGSRVWGGKWENWSWRKLGYWRKWKSFARDRVTKFCLPSSLTANESDSNQLNERQKFWTETGVAAQ